MPLNSTFSYTTLIITTGAVNEQPADIMKNNPQKNSKMIKIQFQTLLLMMIISNLKHQETVITV